MKVELKEKRKFNYMMLGGLALIVLAVVARYFALI